MAPATLPEEVQRLLREHVASFEELEVLLFLHSRPKQAWRGVSVALELHKPPAPTEVVLRALCERGLLEASREGYVWRPRDLEIFESVDRLASSYDERPLDVIQAMTTNAFERVRRSAHRFAEQMEQRRRGSVRPPRTPVPGRGEK